MHKAFVLDDEPLVCTLADEALFGVCPFANPEGTTAYLDVSLKRFDTVFPAAGSPNSAIELSCAELEAFSHSAGFSAGAG
mgnify:CR=1 FL=1